MNDRLLVATRKGLFFVDRSAAGWRIGRTAFLGDNLSLAIEDRRDGALFAVLDHGHFGVKLHRSRDGGDTWTECATPAYPTRPDDDPDDKNPWRLKLGWALETGGADRPGRLWMGTIPGGLFRSEDSGDSWQLVRSLWDEPSRKKWFGGGADEPGIHSICVHPEDSRRVLVAVSCGGVWATEDDGDSWELRARGMYAEYLPPEQKFAEEYQDPHCVVRCPAAPDVLWCQHHNGVFRSSDEGRSWNDVTTAQPSVFGFAVAVHPVDPDTAWFVPAISDEKRIPVDGRLVVSRTRDGGMSFDVLREGLPQEHAYDLVFRHGLDIGDDGSRLAFGSTTGGLFVTEDAGDSWTEVTTRLPPIHSVRFCR